MLTVPPARIAGSGTKMELWETWAIWGFPVNFLSLPVTAKFGLEGAESYTVNAEGPSQGEGKCAQKQPLPYPDSLPIFLDLRKTWIPSEQVRRISISLTNTATT